MKLIWGLFRAKKRELKIISMSTEAPADGSPPQRIPWAAAKTTTPPRP
jgi:hypothetical protein